MSVLALSSSPYFILSTFSVSLLCLILLLVLLVKSRKWNTQNFQDKLEKIQGFTKSVQKDKQELTNMQGKLTTEIKKIKEHMAVYTAVLDGQKRLVEAINELIEKEPEVIREKRHP